MKDKIQTIVISLTAAILCAVTLLGVFGYIKLSKDIHDLNKTVKDLKLKIEESEEPSGYDTTPFKEIKGTDIAKESEGKTIVVFIGRQTCGYCAIYAPIITKVSDDYDFRVRYIDLEKLVDIYSPTWEVTDQESYDDLVNLKTTPGYEIFMDDLGSTPMTIVIRDNKIIGGVVGYVEEETLIQTLKDSGFIK